MKVRAASVSKGVLCRGNSSSRHTLKASSCCRCSLARSAQGLVSLMELQMQPDWSVNHCGAFCRYRCRLQGAILAYRTTRNCQRSLLASPGFVTAGSKSRGIEPVGISLPQGPAGIEARSPRSAKFLSASASGPVSIMVINHCFPKEGRQVDRVYAAARLRSMLRGVCRTASREQ
jgi:hypothetical protein